MKQLTQQLSSNNNIKKEPISELAESHLVEVERCKHNESDVKHNSMIASERRNSMSIVDSKRDTSKCAEDM